MTHFLKVVVFTLLVIGGFWGFSNFGIPQIVPEPPPQEEALDLGAMTMESFVALGEKIFLGKGTCTLCHNTMGRAPMLDKAGALAAERLKDPRYAGAAKTPEEYLHESMVKPSAFVVAGFGKSGSNDTESPMPDVTGGGIGLAESEVKAVIAYLQDSSGAEVTVEIPKDAPADAAPAAQVADAPASSPEAVVEKYGCGACHVVAGQAGAIGPDLTQVGARLGKDALRQSILEPDAVVAKGYEPGMMPPGYGEQLRASELELLVNYLAGHKP
jgi:mono/diheme cytochrome c family protein